MVPLPRDPPHSGHGVAFPRAARVALILNGYSLLALFVGAVELALGGFVAWTSIAALARRRAAGEGLDASRFTLPALAAGVLLGVSVAGWPLLYLMLDSYVPQWIDVMCIQGVAKIGSRSVGAAAWLPTLVQALQVTKPLLVFAMGAALLLHLSNRATRTDPLTGRLTRLLAAAGLLAVLDASAQIAYVTIPKQEQSLADGCCVIATSFVGSESSAEATTRRRLLAAGFFVSTVAMAAWSFAAARGSALSSRSALPLFAATVASLPLGVIFLREVAAPAFLGRPDHACAYCLVSKAPFGLVAAVSYLLGAFATGWACVLRLAGTTDETREALPERSARLLRVGCAGWLVAAVVTAVPLVVA